MSSDHELETLNIDAIEKMFDRVADKLNLILGDGDYADGIRVLTNLREMVKIFLKVMVGERDAAQMELAKLQHALDRFLLTDDERVVRVRDESYEEGFAAGEIHSLDRLVALAGGVSPEKVALLTNVIQEILAMDVGR